MHRARKKKGKYDFWMELNIDQNFILKKKYLELFLKFKVDIFVILWTA